MNRHLDSNGEREDPQKDNRVQLLPNVEAWKNRTQGLVSDLHIEQAVLNTVLTELAAQRFVANGEGNKETQELMKSYTANDAVLYGILIAFMKAGNELVEENHPEFRRAIREYAVIDPNEEFKTSATTPLRESQSFSVHGIGTMYGLIQTAAHIYRASVSARASDVIAFVKKKPCAALLSYLSSIRGSHAIAIEQILGMRLQRETIENISVQQVYFDPKNFCLKNNGHQSLSMTLENQRLANLVTSLQAHGAIFGCVAHSAKMPEDKKASTAFGYFHDLITQRICDHCIEKD